MDDYSATRLEEEVVEKLPGFRFHPTEEELLNFYLRQMLMGKKLRGDIITFLNIYNYDPRELPGLAKIGEREWYFFVPRDRKQGSGGRPNRTTEKGFWKATGSDRKVLSSTDPKNKLLGLRKTLVFYEGRAPRGKRTDWIMNEYRLPDTISPPKDIVLCKIYRKATSMKVLEQRAAMESAAAAAEFKTSNMYAHYATEMEDSMSSFSNQIVEEETNMTTFTPSPESSIAMMTPPTFKKENDDDQEISTVISGDHGDETNTATLRTGAHEQGDGTTTKRPGSSSCLVLPNGMVGNLELQVPAQLATMDWTQDAFWSQFRSPWLDNFTSFLPLCQ